jgi:hypothetical protein
MPASPTSSASSRSGTRWRRYCVNRKHAIEVIDGELRRSRRSAFLLSLVMLDLAENLRRDLHPVRTQQPAIV